MSVDDEIDSTSDFNETKSYVDESDLKVSKSSLIISSFSSSIVGEILNNFSFPIGSIQVIASVYDNSDNLIATGDTYTDLDELRPGEKTGFSIFFFGEKLPKKSKYTLSTEYDEIGDSKPAMLKLKLGKFSKKDFSSSLVGEVTNLDTDDSTDRVKVSAIFYDKNKNIVATETAYTKIDVLEPGKKSPFEITLFSEEGKKVKSYAVNVESNDFSMSLDK